MSEQKIDFHPLERLDLIDVDDLQTLILDYLQELLGNVTGAGLGFADLFSGGVLDPPAITNIDLLRTRIEFNDFTYIESFPDGIGDFTSTGITGNRKARVVTFDAGNNPGDTGVFYSSARNLVTTFYNQNNNTLPPKPGDAGYSETNHGLYYPYIFAKSEEVDGPTGNRRFWNVSNGQETTETRVVRKIRRVIFQITSVNTSSISLFSQGFTRIARISEWGYSNGVTLSSSGITYISLLDHILPLPADAGSAPLFYADSDVNDAGRTSTGLAACFKALRRELELLRSGGTDDATYGTTSTNMSVAPHLSLDGLRDRTDDLQARIEKRALASAVVTLTADGSAGTYTIATDNLTYNVSQPQATPRFQIQGSKDHSILFLPSNVRGVVSSIDIPVNTAGNNFDLDPAEKDDGTNYDEADNEELANWRALLSSFVVDVPAVYAGWELRVNPTIVGVYEGGGSGTHAESKYLTTQFADVGSPKKSNLMPLTAMLLQATHPANGDYGNLMTVDLSRYKDADNVNVNGPRYGFRVGIAGLENILRHHQSYFSLVDGPVTIAVKVEVEVVNLS